VGRIDKKADQVASPVKLRDRPQFVLIQERLKQIAIDLLPDPPVMGVYDIFNCIAIRHCYSPEVTQDVVLIGRRLPVDNLTQQVTVVCVSIEGIAELFQTILIIIYAKDGSALVRKAAPVPIGIVNMGRLDHTVLLYLLRFRFLRSGDSACRTRDELGK